MESVLVKLPTAKAETAGGQGEYHQHLELLHAVQAGYDCRGLAALAAHARLLLRGPRPDPTAEPTKKELDALEAALGAASCAPAPPHRRWVLCTA